MGRRYRKPYRVGENKTNIIMKILEKSDLKMVLGGNYVTLKCKDMHDGTTWCLYETESMTCGGHYNYNGSTIELGCQSR